MCAWQLLAGASCPEPQLELTLARCDFSGEPPAALSALAACSRPSLQWAAVSGGWNHPAGMSALQELNLCV